MLLSGDYSYICGQSLIILTMKTVLLVGLGGALGSIFRYLVVLLVVARLPERFPYGTFTVNVIGSLMIGIIFGLAGRYEWLSPSLRIFLTVGFCGGFTTFSSFSYENANLLQQGQYLTCLIYLLSSVVTCLAATFVGFAITKAI